MVGSYISGAGGMAYYSPSSIRENLEGASCVVIYCGTGRGDGMIIARGNDGNQRSGYECAGGSGGGAVICRIF